MNRAGEKYLHILNDRYFSFSASNEPGTKHSFPAGIKSNVNPSWTALPGNFKADIFAGLSTVLTVTKPRACQTKRKSQDVDHVKF